MGVFSGWQSAVQSVAQTIAQLVGQDIVTRSISLTQTAGNNAVKLVDGALLNLSTADSNSTISRAAADTLVVPGTLSVGGQTGTLQCRRNANQFFIADPSTNILTVNNASGVGIISLGSELRFVSFSDGSGTPGNATNNSVRGRNAIAAAASTCVITNSFVTAASTVLCSLETNDGTATQILTVIPGPGSFTVKVNAGATGTTKFSFVVLN